MKFPSKMWLVGYVLLTFVLIGIVITKENCPESVEGVKIGGYIINAHLDSSEPYCTAPMANGSRDTISHYKLYWLASDTIEVDMLTGDTIVYRHPEDCEAKP